MKNLFKVTGLLFALLISLYFVGCQQQPQQAEKAAPASTNVRMDLIEQSTLEGILQQGELKVGFESGYMPFEMTDKKGEFVGFDIDMAKEMAKAMGVKFVPVNTAWDGIIPALT
ncbi:MAG: transporter substrate-binding domain-containing protein, partial [Deltaproteobacteria bacterium]|nr:transporter substrate-binding domain-containing protein [Deltaproteobacteria bacterium]